MTDGSGAFSMFGVPSGSISLVADKETYGSAETSLNVATSATDVSGGQLILTPQGTTGVGRQPAAPSAFTLSQNYPNPFNPSTRITFTLAAQSNVTLRVFNVLGQEIATLQSGAMTAGTHDAIWSGKDNAGRSVASGVYFYRLNATSINGQTFNSIRKMVLLK